MSFSTVMKFFPTVLWMIICARGMYRWRKNAHEMEENLVALRSNGKKTTDAILFAKADKLMDNLRAFVFLNGLLLGAMSVFVTAEIGWALTPLYQRIFGNYFLWVIVGSFFIFALNGEIYGYVLEKVRKGRS